jgi:hypothetical protein
VKLVVAMTGATGAPIGVRLLKALRELQVETHLVISRWARTTLAQETGLTVKAVEAMADTVYKPDDQGAAIASGSYRVDGMVVAPCSMKTLAALRTGYGDGLIGRAGDGPNSAGTQCMSASHPPRPDPSRCRPLTVRTCKNSTLTAGGPNLSARRPTTMTGTGHVIRGR